MKKYHIKVIGSDTTNYIIEAESISISSAGLYEFVNYPNGVGEVVAYFPVARTIIHQIENNGN
jgi:hypothetical protein